MGIYQLVYGISLVFAAVTVGLLGFLVIRQSIVLRKLKRDDVRCKELLGLAMEYLEEPEFIPAFKAQLKKGDMRLLVRVFVDLLPKLKGDYEDNVVTLMRALGIQETSLTQIRSKKWWRRADAAAILGYFKDPTVVSALEDALDDNDVHVRLEAARSLARQKAISSVAGLVARLSVVDPTHSLAVREIFRSLGKPAVAGLIAVLESDVPESTKLVAADALGHIGDPRAVKSLLKVFDVGEHASDPSQVSRNRGFSDNPQATHRNIALQIAVMHALSNLYDKESVRALTGALDDPLWELRACACECLGTMGVREAALKLEYLMSDNHWWVRYYAASALFEMGRTGLASLKKASIGLSARAKEISTDLLREKGITVPR
jgi:HEAT repeat protein